jgi:hypothetical protein
MSDAQALQHYLESMRAEIANQLQHVNQRLDTVTHEAASSSSAASYPPSHPSGRAGLTSTTGRERSATEVLGKLLNKPSQFHGEHGNRVYDWLSELDILFDNVGTASDHEKITFARQCLRNEALRWWIAREQEVVHSQQRIAFAQQSAMLTLPTEQKEMHQTKPIITWLEFKQAFVDYFCPRGASETARNQLHTLRQSQFRQLAEYCDRFEQVARRISVAPGHDINEELIATFKNGLSDGRIRLHLTTSHPGSLFEATRQAIQAEGDLRVSNYGARDHSRVVGTNKQMSFSHYRSQGYPMNQHNNHGYQRWNHSYTARAHPPSNASTGGDTSTPMDLSVVEADRDATWDISVQEDRDDTTDEEPDSTEGATPTFSDPGEDQSDTSGTEVNFVTRERRPSDRPMRWKRTGERPRFDPSRANRAKQEFLTKNVCWNCGKPGHLLIDCPYQKGRAAIAAAVNESKPLSKKS